MAGFVMPGDIIGEATSFECGIGTYESEGMIRASLLGKLNLISSLNNKTRVDVIHADHGKKDIAIEVGDKVLCRVVRLAMNQAIVEILSVTNRMLNEFPKAIIRREDIRLSEIDQLIIHECFRPGDIVHAVVISLGDARQYYLSTAEVEYGVWLAKSEKSGEILVPISWKVQKNIFYLIIISNNFKRKWKILSPRKKNCER